MSTSKTRSIVGAWLAACFLAAPALAQTRVVATVHGLSAPVAPVVGVQASVTGASPVASPLSFSAATFNAAPSAPDAPISHLAAPVAAAATPILAAAATPSRAKAAAAPIVISAAGRETSSSFVPHAQPASPREAAAIAIVDRGIADWTARAPQSLDAVHAAASHGTEPLARPSAQTPAPEAPHETPSPEAPAPSKLKTFFSWAGPILALTSVVLGLDFGTKYFAVHHMFHMFHEVAWRKPIILGMIPYILYTAWAARSKLAYDRTIRFWSIKKIFNGHFGFYQGDSVSGMNAMVKDHPSLKWAVRIYDVSIALMLGGMLGNGIDTIRMNGAMDWIPLGRSLMNFADVAVILGLSYFQASTKFFLRAGAAHKAGKALYFPYAFFLGLPIAGVFIAWAFGSGTGGGALDLSMKNVGFLYLMAFSMLIGAGRFVGMAIVNIFVKRFVADETLRVAASSKN
jgi:lipoprotein signal peptidase